MARKRDWTELRIRRPELVQDNITLPIQRLREAVADLIKTSEDKEMGQELLECNRRLAELREEVAMFLGQSGEEYVYWVERSGRMQKSLALNAAPVDVAKFLRQRLFNGDNSVIMTSATLSISNTPAPPQDTSAGHSSGSRRPGPSSIAGHQRIELFCAPGGRGSGHPPASGNAV